MAHSSEALVIFELFEDTVKLGFIVFCLFAVFRAYLRLQQPAWSILLEHRYDGFLLAAACVGAAIPLFLSLGLWLNRN